MSVVENLERHQIPLYLAGLLGGAALGLAAPGLREGLEAAIYPVLGALLYATFLQVPFTQVTASLRDLRFLGAILAVNFAVVPVVVVGLTSVVSLEQAVLLGVLLTLLTPCIDYVIVFCGLAGGDSRRLVAASPLLMLAQMAALPLWLWVIVGPEVVDVIEVRPFVEAFGFLILAPLALAALTQSVRHRARLGGRVYAGLTTTMAAAMVPLMVATLFVVVASQVPELEGSLDAIIVVVPLYVAFVVIMTVLGGLAARVARLDGAGARALLFSGVTRNSLVVLPLALALPAGYALTPAVVVTQTLVELVAMVVLIRLVPRLPSRLVPPMQPGPGAGDGA